MFFTENLQEENDANLSGLHGFKKDFENSWRRVLAKAIKYLQKFLNSRHVKAGRAYQ